VYCFKSHNQSNNNVVRFSHIVSKGEFFSGTILMNSCLLNSINRHEMAIKSFGVRNDSDIVGQRKVCRLCGMCPSLPCPSFSRSGMVILPVLQRHMVIFRGSLILL